MLDASQPFKERLEKKKKDTYITDLLVEFDQAFFFRLFRIFTEELGEWLGLTTLDLRVECNIDALSE